MRGVGVMVRYDEDNLRKIANRLTAVEMEVDQHAHKLAEHERRLDAHDVVLDRFGSQLDDMRGFKNLTIDQLTSCIAKLELMHETVEELVAQAATEQAKADARALLRRIRYCRTKAYNSARANGA
jgi:hypothetical protein